MSSSPRITLVVKITVTVVRLHDYYIIIDVIEPELHKSKIYSYMKMPHIQLKI